MKYIKKFNEEYHQEDVDDFSVESKPLERKYTIKDMWDLVEFVKRGNPSSNQISKYIELMHYKPKHNPNAVYIDDGIE